MCQKVLGKTVSDLQPIELVWALIKGNVGRKNSTETTHSMVHNHLMAELGRLEDQGQQSIGKMIEKCEEQVAAMYKEQLEMDEEADECESATFTGISDTSQGDNGDIDQEDIGDSGEMFCEYDIEEKEEILCMVFGLLSCFGLMLKTSASAFNYYSRSVVTSCRCKKNLFLKFWQPSYGVHNVCMPRISIFYTCCTTPLFLFLLLCFYTFSCNSF